jgi:steroid delta-isomerase-like uncharacterized protein
MKKSILVVSLVLLVCFVFGCQNKAEKAELEKFRAQAKIEEQNMTLYRKTIDELNKGNIEFYRETMAPDYVYYFPSVNPKSMSSDETISMIKTTMESFSDLNWSIEGQVAAGDIVISRVKIKGTHTGTYQGIPATGNKVEFGVMNWCRLRDGKIVEEREEVDMFGFLQQLGMELKPKEVKK